MILEMLPVIPECLPDLAAWRPKTYREHVAESKLSNRDAIIASYESADSSAREALDSVSETLNAVMPEIRDVVLRNMTAPDTAAVLASRAAAWVKPLIARMNAIINGMPPSPLHTEAQMAVDEIFRT